MTAQKMRIVREAILQLGNCRVRLIRGEGATQMIVQRGDDADPTAIFNAFCDDKTARELRHIAEWLDRFGSAGPNE